MLDRVRAYLTARLGPLPVWAWLAILVVAVGGFILWRRRSGGSSDTSSTYSGPGLAPVLDDPPFTTDPPVAGGRMEPGWTGPNTSLPPWLAPTDFFPGIPGDFSTLPPLTVPTLPDFQPIPPLGSDGKLTTAQIAIARDRFADKIFPNSPTVNELIPTKTVTKAPAQQAMTPASGNTVSKIPPKPTPTVVKAPPKAPSVKKLPPKSSGSKSYGRQA